MPTQQIADQVESAVRVGLAHGRPTEAIRADVQEILAPLSEAEGLAVLDQLDRDNAY